MRKRVMTACLLMLVVLSASAQEKPQKWYDNIKFSGYGMLQYQAQDKEDAKSNTFNLRLLRMILDGKVGEFDWRAQVQGTNAKGPGEPTVQLVDLYTEWVAHKEFKVRVGQFKRPFTFENPTHPITQGWRGYADVINRLSGFGDMPVRSRVVDVTSVSRCKVMSSPTLTVVRCCTIRWVSSMVRVSTVVTRITARILSVVYG